MPTQQSLFDQPRERPKTLFLLDGMALIYRSFFGLIRNPTYTSGGLNTSAVFGLLNTLQEILKKEKPTHIGAAFDTSEPTHRHKEFPEYKAQRQKMPEELSAQIPYVFRLLEGFNIPVIRVPGVEADDIIGTMVKEAELAGFQTFMVTPDKDYQQLVTEKTILYKPGRQGGGPELMGVAEVLEKWQIERIDQVIDILGLMGDSSDNIPGIPGIGEKTAQKLIAQFGSIENLLKHTDQLKGKQRERVEANAELALLSKRLVTILTDVEHGVTFEALESQEIDEAALKPLFMELEFETLGKRLFGTDFNVGTTRASVQREKREKEIQSTLFDDEPKKMSSLEDVPHKYHTVRTAEERARLFAELKKQKAISLDTETTGLDPRKALPLGLSFSFKPHTGYYVVCPDDYKEAIAVIEEFRPIFEDEGIEKIGHNLKYDLTLLKWHGFEVKGKFMDTMIAHMMTEPEVNKLDLDHLAVLYLNYEKVPTSRLIGEKGEDQKSMRDVPLDQLAEYACEDADITLQISEVIRQSIRDRGAEQLCYEVECPLTTVLVNMEYEGIRIDTEALREFSRYLDQEIKKLQKKVFDAAGEEFNLDSPKQIAVVLFDKMDLDPKPQKTATGQYSTRESELERLSTAHPIIQDILDYRTAAKLNSVYVNQLPATADPKTGRVHTHYSQAWTATGRMQSNNPNLQTIPIRKELGKEIRKSFIPRDENYQILSADYSQIELRILAELSQDKGLVEAFINNDDIHTITAAKVFKIDKEEVTREMRNRAKAVNYGIGYGVGVQRLQRDLNITRIEANALIDSYWEQFPGVAEYRDSTLEFARKNEYTATLTGRRRYLRNINSQNWTLRGSDERFAINFRIQGTAADLLKLAMIKVYRTLSEGGYKTKMLLTVHDELVFDLFKDEAEEVTPLIEQDMKTALEMQVPIVVEMGRGDSWLEAH
ncbi:MAG: DNA polymerase I [Planctomycetota bacterium]|nr:DNA polymerase I [Planctomycetota bacterium]MDA1142012.1 DNA polymerase I [Planctomycetota bacterium]